VRGDRGFSVHEYPDGFFGIRPSACREETLIGCQCGQGFYLLWIICPAALRPFARPFHLHMLAGMRYRCIAANEIKIFLANKGYETRINPRCCEPSKLLTLTLL
jgi:hypothetical protein